jgi:hypothetical protein
MATVVTNSDQIQEWVKAKQRNEQSMLYRLNNLFKTPLPRAKMRRLVQSAIEQMWAELQANWPAQAVWGALMDEQGLAVWQRISPATSIPHFRLQRILESLRQGDRAHPVLDCNDFSELIRVIGAWLEKGGGYGHTNINKALRAGINGIPANQVWGKAVRQREPRSEPKTYRFGGEEVRLRGGHRIESHIEDWWIRPKKGLDQIHKKSGMEMFRANRDDLCKKIDLIFGLLIGATISGTTTDTVIVLEAYGVDQELHAGYYIFPVATIAASLHHTLLEAGLALSIVGAIDSYCVGFYSSLKPKGGFPGELQDALGILQEAEDHPDNRHLLIWYGETEKRPAGCILWEKGEAEAAKNTLYNGKKLLAQASNLPRVPRRDHIVRLIQDLSPNLLTFDLKRQLYEI